ncbi:hypothetical protein FNF28_05754 [Cafeteria roenbergensis]|uniref:Enoyl reductase (ER) domain-containing protein n=1 Tax=Cafeteria roenbergensis TaxID=33653 RepID=A0A5A8D4G3_CAFRO|nr:hypothetical protein FNF28_05754 [Cafeteria roenbergensis]
MDPAAGNRSTSGEGPPPGRVLSAGQSRRILLLLGDNRKRELVAAPKAADPGLDAGPPLTRTESAGGKPEEMIVAIGDEGEQMRVVSVADEPELRPLASIHGRRAHLVAVVADIANAGSMDSARMWLSAAESGIRGGTPLLLVLLRRPGVSNEAATAATALARDASASTWLVAVASGAPTASLAGFAAEFKSRVSDLLGPFSSTGSAGTAAGGGASRRSASGEAGAASDAAGADPWLASSNKAQAFARAIPAAAPAVRVAAFGDPDVLSVRADAPVPVPKPGECLIRVRAVGVNPVDTYIRSGAYARLPDLPYTPGADCAGELVRAVAPEPGKAPASLMVPGTDEHGLPHWAEPGAAVFTGAATSGSYATYAVAPLARVVPFRLRASAGRPAPGAGGAEAAAAGSSAPAAAGAALGAPEQGAAGLTWAQAAAIPTPYFTAYRALNSTRRFAPGCAVLVHGASGAVGIAAVQLATRKGAFVVGTASSEAGRKAVIAAGANAAVGHGDAAALRAALAATGGRAGGAAAKPGFDVIVECLANANLGTDLTLLAHRGHVAVVGSRGAVEVNPRDLMSREASVAGVALAFATDADLAAMMADVGAWLRWTSAAGGASPLVGKSFEGLAGAAEAHREVLAHPGGAQGKLVLVLPPPAAAAGADAKAEDADE